MPNIYTHDLEERDRDGFRSRRRRLGDRAGANRLGASLWEVPPGELAYPYHFHLAAEEMVIVIDGDGELRTPAGWRRLERGEVVAFPVGEGGAHQLRCPGPNALRFVTISTNGPPDIVVYPDSNKVGAYDRDTGVSELYRRGDAVDYWDGEDASSS